MALPCHLTVSVGSSPTKTDSYATYAASASAAAHGGGGQAVANNGRNATAGATGSHHNYGMSASMPSPSSVLHQGSIGIGMPSQSHTQTTTTTTVTDGGAVVYPRGSGGNGHDRDDAGNGVHRGQTIVIMAVDHQLDSQVVKAISHHNRGASSTHSLHHAPPSASPSMPHANKLMHSESLFSTGASTAGGASGQGQSSSIEDEFSEEHIDFWTLRFREPQLEKSVVGAAAAARSGKLIHSLEDGFLRMFFDTFRRHVQKAILTAVSIWALYAINDHLKNEQGLRANYTETLIIRFANCGIGLGCAAALSTPCIQRRGLLMPVVGFAMITFGVAQIVFGMWDENELDPAYSVIMLLIPSTSSTLFKQRFIFTVVFQFALLFLYIMLTYSFDRFHSAGDLVLTAVGLFFANILFAVHAYRREYKMRKDYLMKMQLEREETRSQNLLVRMLPGSVIAKLREGSDFIYYKHESVTLLFSHIHDFDSHTSAMAPLQLIRMLNTLFTCFDELTDTHGVYKVETIGDVYLVSSGCPVEYAREDHAEAIAGFALDMMREAKKFMVEHVRDVAAKAARKLGVASSGKGHGQGKVSRLSPIQLQLGINSGSIISGVVGVKYPRYRLMGDVINTASRMSTTASADQIQMTTRAHEVLNKSYFHTEYRGEVAVKGKGLMKTYLLLGRVELLCPPPLSVEQVQRLNGTLAERDGVAGAEQNFHAAWDGNGSDPHAGPTAAAVAAGAPTHGGLLTESPRTLQSRLHAAQTNAAATPAQNGLSLRGPRDSPRGAHHPHPSLSLLQQPGMTPSNNNNNRRGSLFVEMRPAELPGVPEMLQKLKGGEVGGADLRGRRPSQESSFSGTPRSVTPSSEMREAEDGLNGVLEHQHNNNDVQVLGTDGAVVGQIVRAGPPGDQVEPLLTPGRAPAAGPHRSPTNHTRTHRTTSSVDDTATNVNSTASANNDPPSSSSNVSRSNKKIVLSALDHQSTFKSVRLFSFGPMNAILRPRRKWYHRLDQSFVTDPTLELEFKHVYAKEVWRINKNWINFMWIFLLPLSMYDIINNTALSSSIVGYAWLVRLGGIGTGVWFYYYSQRYTYLKHMQPVSTFVVTVIGVVFITTTAITQALVKSYGVSFVLVLLCLVCMFLGLLFHSAVVSVLIILVSWLIAASISEGGVPGILSLLIAGSVMYLETAYNGEREARHDFVRFRKLYHERLSTHSFLSNMLPPSVFEGLKREDQALVAHERIDADVLFSDIVGFTATATTLKPEDVVAVLNVMFATFDILADKHCVYKVETIGDAYVACANVVEVGRPEHTKLLVDFALAMQKATKSMFTPVGINGSPTQQIVIRVGIHTGTVIAGVVGRKCPRYHLFGETVTIAEEMEQRGVPGAVALSDDAYRSMPPGSLWEYECKELEPAPFDGRRIQRWTIAHLPKQKGGGNKGAAEDAAAGPGGSPFGGPRRANTNKRVGAAGSTGSTPLHTGSNQLPANGRVADGSFAAPAAFNLASSSAQIPIPAAAASSSATAAVGNRVAPRASGAPTVVRVNSPQSEFETGAVENDATAGLLANQSAGGEKDFVAELYAGEESARSPAAAAAPSSSLQTPGAASRPLDRYLQNQAAAAATAASPSVGERKVGGTVMFMPE